MAAEQPPVKALRAGRYVKSSYSPDGTECVMLYGTSGWVGVQDSKEYSSTPPSKRTTLAFTADQFARFLECATVGEFDRPIA